MRPEWLKKSVIKGLQGMLMLRLQGSPSGDTIESLANAWLAVLASLPHTWDQARDEPRIRRAFLTMAANCERWPAPKNFIASLPPVPALGVDRMLTPPRSREIPPQTREWLDKLRMAAKRPASA
jgi:hypothetical protein